MDVLANAAVVDLFCGAGGLTRGFVEEGFSVKVGIDIDETCRFAYEYNNGAKFVDKDIFSLASDDLRSAFEGAAIKIMVGCAPCQPFSSYNNGDRKKDDKWKLLYRFADLILAVRPDVFSMENVPELRRFEHGKVLEDFGNKLSSVYKIKDYDVYCPDYGIPQQRTRLVLFGSLYDEISLPSPTCTPRNYKTVRDAIGSLPPLKAGEICPSDPLHRAASLSKTNLERIRQSKPGGTWRDWDYELRAQCHKKESGKTYAGVYGRMSWDQPSPTMTTLCYGYGNGRFGHPDQDRAISLREAALFQTFPLDYVFVKPGDPYCRRILGRQIGNAVPVKLGKVIAESIHAHLENVFS